MAHQSVQATFDSAPDARRWVANALSNPWMESMQTYRPFPETVDT